MSKFLVFHKCLQQQQFYEYLHERQIISITFDKLLSSKGKYPMSSMHGENCRYLTFIVHPIFITHMLYYQQISIQHLFLLQCYILYYQTFYMLSTWFIKKYVSQNFIAFSLCLVTDSILDKCLEKEKQYLSSSSLFPI